MSCTCLGTPTIVQPPTCPTTDNCLKMADIIVACKDAVGPCGAEGSLDLLDSGVPTKPYCHLTTGCGVNPLRISLLDWSKDILESVTVTGSTLEWVTKDASVINKFGYVYLKACCGELASIFQVIICVKDLCKCSDCTTAEQCNACTGICEPKQIDVGIGNYSTNVDMSIV